MASIQRHVVLFEDSAIATGRWYRLDSKYEEGANRSLQISNPGADTIIVEGTTIERIGGLNPDGSAFDPETDIVAPDIVTLNTYSATDVSDVLNSDWTWIRIRKTTANGGTAKVQGMI